MAEETPQNVNPAVDPQVENPPDTAVPAASIDLSPTPVAPGTNPQVTSTAVETVPAAAIDRSPDPVSPGTNPEVPGTDLPAPIAYPAPETPTQDPIVVAQVQGQIIPGDRGPLRDLPRVPVETVTTSPITGPGAELPTVTVTAPRPPANDPVPVLLDETGTISNIQRNPETGELFNTGEPPQQLTTEQLQRLRPTVPPPDTPAPAPPASPPASQVQTAPAPAPNAPGSPAAEAPPAPPASQVQTAPVSTTAQDYGSSGDAAALEAAQRAEAEAFQQGRVPQTITQDPQVPATDGTTSGPGITGPVPGTSPYGEMDEPRDIGPPTRSAGPGSNQDPQFAESDGTTSGTGITGPVDGISPYGEANDPLAVTDGTTAGRGITGPVDGISPYGEADDPREVTGVGQPGPASGQDYGSSYDAFQLEQAAARERVDFENGRIPRAVINDPQADGLTESEVIPEFTSDPRAAGENVGSVRDQALVNNARNQQAINAQRRNVNAADWRVRLQLAPGSDYLYNAPDPGILAPLSSQSGSNGVIFPYTPTIQTAYKANYNAYDLTHSNYRGYFYQNSAVDDIQITGTFTAQDSVEAAYLLAVIHFFRSATKMFYGQDPLRGAPPPLVYLSGLGTYQFQQAPCAISQFNYVLPADVDYVRANSPNQDGTNLLKRRQRQSRATNAFSAAWQRLQNARTGGLPKGAQQPRPPPPTLGLNSPTYVPTKMEITIMLHPMQSRQQVSQQFSLREYGTGRLTPRGFW